MEGKNFEHPETNRPSPGDIQEAPITPREADKRLDDLENGRIELNEQETNDFNSVFSEADEKLNKLEELNTHNCECNDSSDVQQDNSLMDEKEETQIEKNARTDENKDYKDDNGNSYRVANELLPNNTYEINGYTYETDEQGRIISAQGMLHIKDREGRLPIKDSIEDIGKGDEFSGDDRGHLIGDQFDGSNGLENMIPQNAEINRGDFKNFENELAKEVKDGKEVHVKVEPVYNGDSKRPEAIVVTYSINGEENVRIFPNGKE